MKPCNAEIHLPGAKGADTARLRCQLDKGHTGRHYRRFLRWQRPAEIKWEGDDLYGDEDHEP
jgi:hypothetical protein